MHMYPALELVDESAGEHTYANRPGRGWLFLLPGLGLSGVGILGGLAGGGLALWFFAALGLLFAFGGLCLALYRMELVLDFSERRYRYSRGFAFSSREEGERPFDDVGGVVLEKDLTKHGDVKDWELELELEMGGSMETFELDEFDDERTARREAQNLASRLGVSLEEDTEG